MASKRAPRRTEREKFEDYFFGRELAEQARLLDHLRSLHRLKQRQFSEGLVKQAEREPEHDAGGMDFGEVA